MQAKWSYFKNVPLLLWRSYIFSRTAIRKHAFYFDKIASFLQKDPHERLTELLIQLLLLLVGVSVDFLSSSKGSSSRQPVDLFIIPLISGISFTSEMPKCIPQIMVVLCKIQPDRDIYNCPEQCPRTVCRLFMESSELKLFTLRLGMESRAQAFQVESCQVPLAIQIQANKPAQHTGKCRAPAVCIAGMQTQLPPLCSSAQSKSREICS